MGVVATLFLFSGMTGLVYEVLWERVLALVLGNGAQAHALILASFLGGLALGNAALGRLADSVRSPLRLYGLLELGVGACGLLAPRLILGLGAAIASAANSGGWAIETASACRLVACLLILLPPTFLLGGTLPALSRFLARSSERTGRSVALLYFLNSAGAAIGALGAGLCLIPALGLELTGSLAAGVNIAIGAIALALSPKGEIAVPAPRTPDNHAEYSRAQVRLLLGVVFISGFIALAWELAWIRLLTLIVGASVYSFPIMLSAFIAGIALGSLFVHRRIDGSTDCWRWFGAAQAGAGAALLLTFPLYSRLPYLFHRINGLLLRTPDAFTVLQCAKFLFCFALMLAPTVFLGAALPLAAAVAARGRRDIGGAVGGVFAWSTLGDVLGALTAGLLLMPVIGLEGLLLGGAALQLAAGAAVLAWPNGLSRTGWFAAPAARQRRRTTLHPEVCWSACAAALALLAVTALRGGLDRRALLRGEFRLNVGQPVFDSAGYRAELERYTVAYNRDGADSTVAVTDKDGWLRQLKVNGKVDASTGKPDMTTQALIAHIPLLLRPQSRTMLLIGLGSGVTAGSALTHPLDALDIAELSPEVVEASAFFSEVNRMPLRDPRTRLHVRDARSVLQLDGRRYDVIVSEPSNPWMGANASLFSRECFLEYKARLKGAGLMVQWLHTYEMDDDTLRLVLRTFSAAFPHAEAWMISRDLALIGSERPLAADFAALEKRLARPAVREDLARVGISRTATLLSLHAADDEAFGRIAGPGPVHEDLFPILAYRAAKAFFATGQADVMNREDPRRFGDSRGALLLTRYLRERGTGLSSDEFAEIVDYHRGGGLPIDRLIRAWVVRFPKDPRALWARARLALETGDLGSARADLGVLRLLSPENLEALKAAADLELDVFRRERSYLSEPAIAPAVDALSRLIKTDESSAVESNQKLALLFEAGRDYANALAAMEAAMAAARRLGSPEAERALMLKAAEFARAAGDAVKARKYDTSPIRRVPAK